MKIRIKGNTVRIRLTRSEVAQLSETGAVREVTHFPTGTFTYEVVRSGKDDVLSASLEDRLIRFYMPEELAASWPGNEIISYENWVTINTKTTLHLLLEKDFQCLEVRGEDESDQYPNPKAIL